MTAASISFRASVLPWAVAPEDEARFRRILRNVLLVTAVLVCLFLLWPKPKVDRTAVQELAPQMARILLERRPLPPPAKPKDDAAKPKDEAADKKADEPKAEAAPETKAPPKVAAKPAPKGPTDKAPVPEARQPVEGKAPGEVAVTNARRKAAGVGLLALSSELSAMTSGAPAAVQINRPIVPGPGVGTTTGPGVGAGNEVGLPERALITSNATTGSGGINTAALSRDTGGGGLAGRATTLVPGVAGGGGGGGPGGGGGADGPGGTGRGGKGAGAGAGTGVGGGGDGAGDGGSLKRAGPKASRSLEEVRLEFDRNKGALNAIYQRMLRDDPTLQGKLVVELKILPSGAVTAVRVVSSELQSSELEQKILARIRQFNFGGRDVNDLVTTYPVHFLPS